MTFITTPERVGREAGLAEGLERGRQEAARESLLAGIEVALELKFATPDPGLLSEIQQIDDVELLRKILQAVKRATSPEELRQLWFQSPPAGK